MDFRHRGDCPHRIYARVSTEVRVSVYDKIHTQLILGRDSKGLLGVSLWILRT